MASTLTRKRFAKSISISILAQAVSVLVGFILNLVVPKFIDEYDYSYWQSYLLYAQYVGILHFGLLDGIVLRYSQYDYDELDKRTVHSQYAGIIAIDVVCAILLLLWALFFQSGVNRILSILLACSICIKITFSYVSFTFQTTNRISKYVTYTIAYRILYCAFVVACLVSGLGKYYFLCIADLLAEGISAACFGLRYSRELLLGKLLPWRDCISEIKSSISGGAWLMLSSYAATFLIGSGKMIIQWRWGELTFGKISLTFSLSSFILQFVTAVSVVLFPSIKRMKQEQLPKMYSEIRNVLSLMLFSAMLLYYPGSLILELWLPKYAESIRYLGILFPIMIYTSKVSLLTNNYLKAYRKEKTMLFINIGMVLFGSALFLICAWVFNNLTVLLLMIVMTIMLRSVISEIAVIRIVPINLQKDFIIELVMTAVFILSTTRFGVWGGCLLYAISIIVYAYIKRAEIRRIFQSISLSRKRAKPHEHLRGE